MNRIIPWSLLLGSSLGWMALAGPVPPTWGDEPPAHAQIRTVRADSWRLSSPPDWETRRNLGIPGLLSVDVRREDLVPPPSNAPLHPVARLLNSDWVVHVQPNPQAIVWRGHVKIDGEPHTANLAQALSPDARKTLQGQSGFGQHLRNGGSTLRHILGMIPLSILCLPAIPYFIEEIQRESRHRKTALKDKRVSLLLDDVRRLAAPWSARIGSLQQTFNDTEAVEAAPADPHGGRYHVLPSRAHFALDPGARQIRLAEDGVPRVSLRFAVLQPITVAEIKARLAAHAQASGQPETEFSLYRIDPTADDAMEDREHLVLKTCTYSLTHWFEHSYLHCSVQPPAAPSRP